MGSGHFEVKLKRYLDYQIRSVLGQINTKWFLCWESLNGTLVSEKWDFSGKKIRIEVILGQKDFGMIFPRLDTLVG